MEIKTKCRERERKKGKRRLVVVVVVVVATAAVAVLVYMWIDPCSPMKALTKALLVSVHHWLVSSRPERTRFFFHSASFIHSIWFIILGCFFVCLVFFHRSQVCWLREFFSCPLLFNSCFVKKQLTFDFIDRNLVGFLGLFTQQKFRQQIFPPTVPPPLWLVLWCNSDVDTSGSSD